MAADGELSPQTPVRKADTSESRPAIEQAELFGPLPVKGAVIEAAPVSVDESPHAAYPVVADSYAPPGVTLSYYTPEAHLVRGPQYGGFWLRILAYVIDSVIVRAVQVFLEASVATATDAPFGRLSANASAMLVVAGIVMQWLYSALQECSSAQATLGKRACGIIVTDLVGKPISFGRATGRHFGKYVSSLTLTIGFVMAAFTKRKQALHDLMAGTLVVKKLRQ